MNPAKSFLKAVLFGFVAGWLLFFFGVFAGLVGLAVAGMIQGTHQDFSVAYKYVGAPLALLGIVGAFIASIVRDLRRIPHNSD